MATKYVDQVNGQDTNDGSQSKPWKNWSHALYGKRLSGGDTLVLTGGVHNALYGSAIFGVTDVGGTGGDVKIVGAASLGTEIQPPANLTDGMIRGAKGGPRLLFEGIKFTNPGGVQERIGEAVAESKLAFKNCEVDYGVGNFPFDLSGGQLEIIGGKIISAQSPVNTRRDNGAALLSGVYLDDVKFGLYGSKRVNFQMVDCEISGKESFWLIVYSGPDGGLTGFVKKNKIHLTSKCKTPLNLYDAVYNALERGEFAIEDNIFYRDLFGLNASARLKIYHDISAKQSGGCRYIPPKNYFVAFDSAVAQAVLSGQPLPQSSGDAVYGCGDSIVKDGRWKPAFKEAAGKDGHATENTAIGGARMSGAFWLIDDMMRTHNPKYVYLQAGINDFFSKVQDDTFIAQAVQLAVSMAEKVKTYGAIPIWCGCTPRNATQNEDIAKFNTQSKAAMNTIGVKSFSIYEEFLKNPAWATEYYDNIASDVHPNAAGQAAIGKAWGEFYKNNFSGVLPPPPMPGDFSAWVPFTGTMPSLAFAPAAPGKLKEVQVWDKIVGKDEIDGVPQ